MSRIIVIEDGKPVLRYRPIGIIPQDFPDMESHPDNQDFIEAVVDWEIEHDIEKDYP